MTTPSRTNLTGRAGRWSAGHPWRAIGLWLAFVVVAVLAGGLVGTTTLSDADSGSGESGRAGRTYADAFEVSPGENVLLTSSVLRVDDPAFRAAVQDVVDRVLATGRVLRVRSPLDPAGQGQVSADRHGALVQFDLTGPLEDAATTVVPAETAVADAARAHPDVRIEQSGDGSISRALDDTIGKDLTKAERLSLPITMFVLLLTFGALVAAVLPLALAMTAIVAAGGLLAFTSQVWPSSDTSSPVLLLIGLAVGVDYSLFYVKREREERARGAGTEAALLSAAATSGRAVLISGITVLIAMSGMFLAGPVFVSIGEAAMLVVLTAMIGSLTVLPAMLSLLGDRVERGRVPYLGRLRHADRDSRAWTWVLDRALRRPVVAVLGSTAVLLLLAAPATVMHTVTPGVTDLPQDLPVIRTYQHIQQVFPGGGAPAMVVVSAPDVTAEPVQAGLVAMRERALATGRLHEPISVDVSDNRRVAVVRIGLDGTGEDTASEMALRTLRDQVLPATLGAVPGVRADVTGLTAGTEDFNAFVKQRAVVIFGMVLVLAFLLLLVSFRSLVIAVKAIALNLLSVAAAYGVLVAVFQWGWGERLLGFESPGSIASWLPLFLFVVLFGLSMDYHVFILSRVREAYDRGATTESAVASGIKATAGTVTAAATVMVFVFLTFATLSQVSMKELGVGLAVAVLLDATLVRGLLLPATMSLLGDGNWYLPGWLAWLPEVSHGAELPSQVPAGAVPAQSPAPDERTKV
jgi:uncharacterized membrane protein YdfJ with MMPL/SSD domain